MLRACVLTDGAKWDRHLPLADFGIKGKLSPSYIGLYSIINKYGPTSHQVELPPKLSEVHNVFDVSHLKRCLKPPTDVVI
jgi:hypothetical protein